MTAALRDIVISLAAVLVLLNGAIVAMRAVHIRRQKRLRGLRPGAETLLAEHLAGTPAIPSASTRRDRAVLLDVALEAIADLRGEERARLVDLLQKLGFVSGAVSGLSARRRVSRQRAAEVLATIGSRAAAGALTSALADRDPQVAVTCAYTLAEIGGEDVLPALLATIVRHAVPVPGTAAAAILALGVKQSSALAPLLASDMAAHVRMTAIEVVSELRLPQYLPALRACLADGGGTDSDDVAAVAARGLGLIGDAEAVEALTGLASDTSRTQEARVAATQALGSIGDPQAVCVLEAQLRARDWMVRAASTRALGELGEPGIEALRRAANSDSADVRSLAEAALQP